MAYTDSVKEFVNGFSKDIRAKGNEQQRNKNKQAKRGS